VPHADPFDLVKHFDSIHHNGPAAQNQEPGPREGIASRPLSRTRRRGVRATIAIAAPTTIPETRTFLRRVLIAPLLPAPGSGALTGETLLRRDEGVKGSPPSPADGATQRVPGSAVFAAG
jgi:hypothetical protein